MWSIAPCRSQFWSVHCCLCRLVDRNNHRWRFGTFKSLTDATYFLARQVQNLRWNLRRLTPSFGLPWWYGLKNIFLGIKLFVFQDRELKLSVSVWNWISWNLIKIQLIPLIQTIIWLSWNFVRFHDFFFQTDSESFSFLSWKTKKFYSKNKLKPLSISIKFIKTKKLCLTTQFSVKFLKRSFDFSVIWAGCRLSESKTVVSK